MAEKLVVPKVTIRGSRQYVEATISVAKTKAQFLEKDARPFIKRMRDLHDLRVWESILLDEPKTWERFCAEVIGYEAEFVATIDAGVSILERTGTTGPIGRKQAVAAVVEEAKRRGPIGEHGTNQHGKGEGGRYIVTSSKRGNRLSYLSRRLLRDAPEVFTRLEAGEFRSVRAAAIEAGIVKVPTALEVAKRAVRKLNMEDRKALVQWIAAQWNGGAP